MAIRPEEDQPSKPGRIGRFRQEEIEQAARDALERIRPPDNVPEWVKRDFRELVETHVESNIARYQKARAEDELKSEEVFPWDRIRTENTESLEKLLNKNPREEDIQVFLEEHPEFLVQTLGGGHGRFQLNKVSFGGRYVADFLIAEASSIGIEWYLIEIESPSLPLEKGDGSFRAELNHAIDQIKDWRSWIMNNQGVARKPRGDGGLGLVGIDSRARGLVIGGRRHSYSRRFNELRRQLTSDQKIAVHSYDWLVDTARMNQSGRLTFEIGPLEPE